MTAPTFRGPEASSVFGGHEYLVITNGSDGPLPAVVTSPTCRNQIGKGVVQAVSINMINDQTSVTSIILEPSDFGCTPMAWMDSRADGLIEDLPVFHDLSRNVGQGMSMMSLEHSVCGRHRPPVISTSMNTGTLNGAEPAGQWGVLPRVTLEAVSALDTVTCQH